MIKLLDFRREDPSSALLYADTKAEVPASAEGFEGLIEGDLTQFFDTIPGAGTLIITSAFETAFVRSDGLIQWKGDPAPTPPAVPATVTITMQSGLKCRVGYLDANDDNTLKSVTYTTSGDYELTVPQNSTIFVVPGDGAATGGNVITSATTETVYQNSDNGAPYTIVIIEEDTAITIGY